MPCINPTYRFGVVEEELYRGGYPKESNHAFLKRLSLRTIVSLTPDPPSQSLLEFSKSQGINSVHIRVDKPKESIPLSFPKVAQILLQLIDAGHQPLYLHCLDGSVVCSMVVMCLRKLQLWTPASYVAEAMRFIKEESVSTDEAEFVDKFPCDVEVACAGRLVKWLWPFSTMQPYRKHPTLKLRWPSVEQSATEDASVANVVSQSSSLSNSVIISGLQHLSTSLSFSSGLSTNHSRAISNTINASVSLPDHPIGPSKLSQASISLDDHPTDKPSTGLRNIVDSPLVSPIIPNNPSNSTSFNNTQVFADVARQNTVLVESQQDEELSLTIQALDLEIWRQASK